MAKRRKKSNKTLYILLGVVAILIVVVVVGKSAGFIGKKKELEVTLSEAKETTIIEKVSASGMIQPVNEVKISPDVSGEIIELNIEEGDSVAAGALLAKIRPDNFINALRRTEANLNQMKANLASSKASLARSEANYIRFKDDYDRNKKLWDEQVISEASWQLAENNYKVAQNDLESSKQNVEAAKYIVISATATVEDAKENLRLTTVYAPVSGTISKLDVEQGERVVGTQQFSGTEMLRIADLNKMEVRVDVNENDIIRISEGDTAIIDVDSYSFMEKQFEGIVTQIASTANPKTSPDAVTEFEVKIRILNSSFADLRKEGNNTPFRPGMTASVDIITERKSGILTVPLAAVTTRNASDIPKDSLSVEEESTTGNVASNEEEKKEVVFVYRDGVAKIIQVKTGISDYDNIEILEGIEPGDQIVSGPFLVVSRRLKDGDEIVSDKPEDEESGDDEEASGTE
jgi:HlyD family secretion protein